MSLATARAAADYFGVTYEGMFSTTRLREFVYARYAVFYVMKERDGQSYPQIGRRFKRDHATVIHGCQVARKLLVSNPDFAAFLTAQMALPKHSPEAAILQSPYKLWEPAPVASPKVAVWKAPVAVATYKPAPKPVRVLEQVKIAGCHKFTLDQDGFTREDRDERNFMIAGSLKLKRAIQQARAA